MRGQELMEAERMAYQRLEVIKHTEINEVVFFISEFVYKGAHMHSEMELDLLLSGQMYVRTNREFYEAKEGEVLLFNPYETHEFISSAAVCRMMTIYVKKDFCRNYFPAFEGLFFSTSHLAQIRDPWFQEKLRLTTFNLGYNYYLEEFGFELRCYSDLNALIYLLVRFVPCENPAGTQRGLGPGDGRMNRVTAYMKEHFQEKLTLKELAEREHISASHLSHALKKMLGMSFQEYLNTLRFERAIQLLVQTELRLIDICYESGFSESKYFNKIFEQNYHMKPKDFRKLAQNSWGSAVPQFERGGRTFYEREDCLKILRSYFHYTCDEKEGPGEAWR